MKLLPIKIDKQDLCGPFLDRMDQYHLIIYETLTQ